MRADRRLLYVSTARCCCMVVKQHSLGVIVVWLSETERGWLVVGASHAMHDERCFG
jgi:hypothetical protein